MADELRQLIQHAHRDRQARARAILDDCLERLPHYQGLPEPLLEEVQESILHHLSMLYRVTLETGRPLEGEDLAYSRQLSRKRAAQGVPLGEFLNFFLVGLTHAWEHLIASAGDDPVLRAQLLDRVSPVISNQTRLMSALTEAYVEERERLSRFREQDLDDLAQLLLAEEALPGVLEARVASLGIDLEEAWAVAVVGPPVPIGGEGASVNSEDLRRSLAARLAGAPVWVGRSREGFVALLPEAIDLKTLSAGAEGLLGEEARVGLGRGGRGVVALRRSAREALRALRIGMGLGDGRRARSYAEVAVLDLIGFGSPGADDFAHDVLGGLAEPGAHEAQLETLRQLSAHNYRIKVAAAALSIHPHTLSYRVRQIQRRFGLDLEDPETRLRVQLALLILDAAPARAGT